MSLVLDDSVCVNQPQFVVDETIINIEPKTFTKDLTEICTKYDNVNIINLPHIKFTDCTISRDCDDNGNKRFFVSFGNNISTYSVHNIHNLCRLIKKKYTGMQ